MKKAINTNAIVFVQDNNAVVATRDGKNKYLAHELLLKNKPIYEALGGVRREGVKYFCVDFLNEKNAKAFVKKAIAYIDDEEYAKTRKSELKTESKVTTPAPAKGKKADELVEVTLADGTKAKVKASALNVDDKKAPRKTKGDVKPTTAPNANRAESKVASVAPCETNGNEELTDAQKKALEVAKNSVLNRAAAAYSVANGGTAQVTFKSLGKSEKELAQYIPNAKVGMMKSKKWAYATDKGITEDMLGF